MALRTPTPRTAARRTPWAWAASGALLGLLAGVLVYAPARWLAQGLSWSNAPVQLHNPAGTLWDGSAQLALQSRAQDRSALPGRITWSLRPRWMAGAPGLAARWQADCCLRTPWSWQLQVGPQGLQWRADDLPADQPLQIPTALLAGLGTPWNTVQAQGQLALNTQGLSLQWRDGRWQLQGVARLDALQFSTSLSTLQPVGSYQLTVRGGDTASLVLRTLDGALRLSGTGSIGPQGVVFDGEASAAEGREEALSNLLNIIGQRQGARSLIHLG